MGSNPGYLLQSFLLYKEKDDIPPNVSSFDFFDMKSMQFKFGNDKKEPNASKMIRVSSLPRGPSLLPTVIVGHFTLYTETMVWKLLKNSVHITFGLPFVHTSAYTCIPHIVTLRFLLYVLVLVDYTIHFPYCIILTIIRTALKNVDHTVNFITVLLFLSYVL